VVVSRLPEDDAADAAEEEYDHQRKQHPTTHREVDLQLNHTQLAPVVFATFGCSRAS